MGDVLQMLRGLCEVPADPARDGALAQALVLGGLGQRLRLQRLVHAPADPEPHRPPVPPAAHELGGQAQVAGPRSGPASSGRGG